MRKLVSVFLLIAAVFAAGLFSPSATADTCVTFCSDPDPCGYVCCFEQCCGKRCVILDCAPPPPCDF